MSDVNPLRAKRHAVLETLKKDLSRGFLEKEVVVMGHKYLLHTLDEDAEVWSDSYVRTSTAMSLMTSRKVPRLAVAIQKIDDISVLEMFSYPDSMSKQLKDGFDADPVSRKYWVWQQMMLFLSESTRAFIEALYIEYENLEKERDEAIKEVPNL
jgi:hypothetical protein